MAPTKCRKCKRSHPAPRGKKCRFFAEEQAAAPEPQLPVDGQDWDGTFDVPDRPGQRTPSRSPAQSPTRAMMELILSSVNDMGARLSTLEATSAQAREAPAEVRSPSQVRPPRPPPQLSQSEDSDDDNWDPAGAGAPRQSRAGKSYAPLRSGATMTARDKVVKRMDWPHFYVFRPVGQGAAVYDELALTEFVFGYIAILNNPLVSRGDHERMLWHLQTLMLDAGRYPWPQVRRFHEIVVHHMETGDITWADTGRIRELHELYAGSPAVSQGSYAPKASGVSPRPKQVQFCSAFQTNTCESHADHDSPRGYLRHVCAYCMRVVKNSPAFPHGEFQCERKARDNAKKDLAKN